MVKRYLAGFMLALFLLIGLPMNSTVAADPPPPSSFSASAYAPTASLADRYLPEDLVYYSRPGGWTPEGMKHGMEGQVSSLLSSIHGFFAVLVKMTITALDLAWNFNLSRYLGGAIDSVAARFSGVVWGFGGVAFGLAALWTAIQVWNSAYNRLTAGVTVMVGVMCLGVMVSTGPSTLLAQVEDIASEVSVKVLSTPETPNPQQAVNSMTDAIYQQLILEPWARANFKDLETAQLYASDGVAGAQLWHLSEDQAKRRWETISGSDRKEDLLPWYDNPVGRRVAVLLTTFLSLILVLPITALFGLLVLGAKLFTAFFAGLLPVAVFVAFLPFFRGVSFLRGWFTWTCAAPIIQVICSFTLGAWMAFSGGLMDSASTIPGGWATVTLIIGAFTILVWKMGRPILRLFASLLFKAEVEKVAEKAAARSTVEETTERLSYRRAEGARAVVANPFMQQRSAQLVPLGHQGSGAGQSGAFAGQRATLEALEIQKRTIRRLSDAMPAQAAKATAGAPERTGLHPLATLPVVRQAAKQHEPRAAIPELSMVDLIREAKKLVGSMAQAAKSGGR